MFYLKTLPLLVGLGTLTILVASVPTSVLIRDTQLNNNLKAKRSISSEKTSSVNLPPIDSEPKDIKKSFEVPLRAFEQARKSSPKKRGIKNDLPYDDFYSTPSNYEEAPYLPGMFHSPVDFQQGNWGVDEPPLSNYNSPYVRQYGKYQPSFLDYGPSYKYYGDRKKRSNKLNIPLKRDSLTPADMLALVALVEAGERSRHSDFDEADDENEYNKSNGNFYPTSFEIQNGSDDNEYGNNVWLEPALVDYYGIPYSRDSLGKYEMPHKFGNGRPYDKRFMVSRKKRSALSQQ